MLALLGVYGVITLILGALALLPLVVPHERLLPLVPECTARERGEPPCPLCGMTTAYLDISRGRWGAAARNHRGAVPLYLFSIINLALFPPLAWSARDRMEAHSP
ncbi:MAG: DUF2752 domain-containing protein [Acidobacteria bacterium]|nr:DUF2752 domain-containing protein [Acidobacteriota bacterium]